VDNAIIAISPKVLTLITGFALTEEHRVRTPFAALSSILANPDAQWIKAAQVRKNPISLNQKDRKHDIDYLAEKILGSRTIANLSYEHSVP